MTQKSAEVPPCQAAIAEQNKLDKLLHAEATDLFSRRFKAAELSGKLSQMPTQTLMLGSGLRGHRRGVQRLQG